MSASAKNSLSSINIYVNEKRILLIHKIVICSNASEIHFSMTIYQPKCLTRYNSLPIMTFISANSCLFQLLMIKKWPLPSSVPWCPECWPWNAGFFTLASWLLIKWISEGVHGWSYIYHAPPLEFRDQPRSRYTHTHTHKAVFRTN